MKYNKRMQVISGILCIIMLFSSFAGCGKEEQKKPVAEPMELMEIEEVDTFSFDFIGGTDVMPIGGYFGPQTYSYSANGQKLPDYFSDEFMELVVGCGVNIITANGAEYSTTPEKTLQLLDQAEKYGIGVFVRDNIVNGNLGENTLSLQDLDNQLHNYINHPACIGAYVVDEPKGENYLNERSAYTIKDYSPLLQNLNSLGVVPYTNLFPLASSGVSDVYREYLQELMDCDVPFLSYDKYPFIEKNTLAEANMWFRNMALAREAAESEGIPFWGFVMAGGDHNDSFEHFDTEEYLPSEGAFMWSANTALAFGAKGLQYFPLLQPYWYAYATDGYDFGRNGLIGAWNNKNRWWYWAKNINEQIAAVDEVLMNSVNKGVIVSGEFVEPDFNGVNYVLEEKSWRELSDVSGNAMVGCFNYFGKSAFYVVNYDIEYAQKITLDFADNYKMKVVQEGDETYYATDSLELAMAAGEGVLVVME